ncbi:MAG: alpha/beta fold hydrolase [Bacteroidota bacterium]
MTPYKPPFFLPNGHFQTIIPSIFRKVRGINYKRERIKTPDNDFLDLDWCFASNKSQIENCKDLVIISHGLEGDSHRQYAKGMAKIFVENGFDTLAWNFRGCGNELNKTHIFYHSGATYDLETVIEHAHKKGYQSIYLIGFSLGGNLTLKYLGERNPPDFIKKAVVFSVPMDLAGSSIAISKPANWIYEQRFLKSLSNKIRQKSLVFPEVINTALLGKMKTLEDFDNEYTSKLHGFINAKDYYAKNSSIIFVENITVPTLIVNAKNDPFLSEECYPVEKLKNHSFVKFEQPLSGGHCGFWQKGYKGFLWSELRALKFIKN